MSTVLLRIGLNGTVLLARAHEVSLKVSVLVVTVPPHCDCHAPQTVPIAFLFCATSVSKLPSLLMITSGSFSTSNHSSPDGDNLHIPAQAKFNTGLRFSTRVAYGCDAVTLCSYGSVRTSPVL